MPQKGNPHKVSRKHKILKEQNCITLIGGKLTNHRKVAQELGDVISKKLRKRTRCKTHHRPLPGGTTALKQKSFTKIQNTYDLSTAEAKYLYSIYGARIIHLLSTWKDSELRPIDVSLPCLIAQVRFAIEEEHALTLLDILARLGISPLKTIRMSFIEKLAQIAGKLAHWNQQTIKNEIAAYTTFLEKSLSPFH